MDLRISNFKFQLLIGSLCPLLSVAFLAGCVQKQEPSDAAEKAPSLRIISMAPNLTEILFGLGLDEEIVGVTKYSTYPPAAQQKANVGTFWQPDMEAVIALRPTLMVNLWFDQQAAVVSRMEQIGCRTLTLRIKTIEELYAGIGQIGKAVDRQTEAQAMIRRLQDKQAAMTARYAGRDKPKVLWVIQRQPFRAAGRQTFINELIELAGGTNAVEPTLTQYPPINTEAVIGSMADVIIEPVMDPARFDEQQQSAPDFYRRYEPIPAVRDGRIYIIDGDVVSRLGPRLDEAVEKIATCLWQDQP